jgi:para-nitrobenzyl esterase
VVDGVVISKQPVDALRDDALPAMPIMLGTTSSEAAIFFRGLLGDAPLRTDAEYLAALQIQFGDAADTINARYPVSQFASPRDALARVTTLSAFTCPARTTARAFARAGRSVFLYELTRATVGGLLSSDGPAHMADLPYLFDYASPIFGSPGDDGRPLVHAMQDDWARFAKGGDPNDAGDASWPGFTEAEHHAILNVPVTEGASRAIADCDFWDGVALKPLAKTYD